MGDVFIRAVSSFSAGHRYKIAFVPFYDFDVVHDETIVESNRGDCFQFTVVVLYDANPNVCDFHLGDEIIKNLNG